MLGASSSLLYGLLRLRILYKWNCGWIFERLGVGFTIRVILRILGGGVSSHLCGSKRDGERLCCALVEMGPSFIKLGQALSVRSDLLGDFAEDLALLQDRIEGFSFFEVEKILKNSLGDEWQHFYEWIEKEPVGSASVAQVHKAKTKEGEIVAIKILRPGIVERFDKDINLFYFLAGLLEFLSPQIKRRTDLKRIIAEFRHWTSGELDFRKEAACATELKLNFKGDDRFFVPEVYWHLTSKDVLTITWIDGVRIDDFEGRQRLGTNDDELLRNCADIFFLQAFRDGFFHGDLHPGNIFVDAAGRLCPVDFGIMGRLEHRFRRFLGFTLSSFLSRDYDGLIEAHREADMLPKDIDEQAFKHALMRIGEPSFRKSGADISIAHLLAGMIGIFREFQVKPRIELLLLDKTMLMAEGVGKKLNPAVNIWSTVMPSMELWLVRERRKNFNWLGEAKRWKERLDKLGKTIDADVEKTSYNDATKKSATAIHEENEPSQGGASREVALWLVVVALSFVIGLLLG